MRYLIITPDPVFGHHVATLVRRAGHVADTVFNELTPPPLLRRYVRDYAVDAVVLDVSGGALHNLQSRVLRWRQAVGPEVLLLTVVYGGHAVKVSLGGGADACHMRDQDARNLLARLEAGLRRRHGFCSDVLQVGPCQLCLRTERFRIADHPVHLTRFELQVVELLMRFRGRVLTRIDILLRLGPEGRGERRHSLDVIVGRVRRKLSPWLPSPDAYIRTVRGVGYFIDAPVGTTSAVATTTTPVPLRMPVSPMPVGQDAFNEPWVRHRHAGGDGSRARQHGWAW